MERGIVLLAYGHPNYGKLAENCATSAKVNSPEIPIQLICTPKVYDGLNKKKRDILFDIITIKEESELLYINGVREAGLGKTKLYDYAAFEQNLFIDVDSMVMPYKKLTELFDILATKDEFIVNIDGFTKTSDLLTVNKKVSQWAPNTSLAKLEILGNEVPENVYSAVIYFRKGDLAKKIFSDALEGYNYINSVDYVRGIWFNSVPDELLFTIAISKNNYHPEFSKVEEDMCIGMHVSHMNRKAHLLQNYYILSFPSGNNKLHSRISQFYNDLAINACRTLKVNHDYNWIDKNRFK